MASEQPRTIPLKVLVDKQSNKVVFVEATKGFVDTLFSFLSLPLGTIVRLLASNNNDQQHSKSSPFLGSIHNLYQTVENLDSNDVWNNPVCKQMLLHPRNPFEALCMNLFLNVDDTEPSNKIFVCDSCNMFTTFKNLDCTCGKPTNKQPQNLDSSMLTNIIGRRHRNRTIVDSQKMVFFRENYRSVFMVYLFDDLKIVPSSIMSSLQLLKELGYSDLNQLEQVTHNIGKQEMLNILKYSLTSNEPLTNTILTSSSENKDNLPSQSSSAVVPCTSGSSKMDIKVVHSKSQKKIIFAEANGDFVNFIFSFLSIPLGSIVKLLGANSFAGCVGNLYKSVEYLDPISVLLNPGIAPQFGCPNQPLNIPHLPPPPTTYYYYGTGTQHRDFKSTGVEIKEKKVEGGVVSKTKELIYDPKGLRELDPPNRAKEGVVGFVKRAALFGVKDDLTVKPLSANSCLSYFKESSIPLDDLEAKVISIGEVEALSLLRASLTSKFTLTSGLGDFLNVPEQESILTSTN